MDSLLTMHQVSQRTGIPLGTLRHRRLRGLEPRSFRLGGRVVYKAEDVDRWIERCYTDGTGNTDAQGDARLRTGPDGGRAA